MNKDKQEFSSSKIFAYLPSCSSNLTLSNYKSPGCFSIDNTLLLQKNRNLLREAGNEKRIGFLERWNTDDTDVLEYWSIGVLG